MDGTNRYRFSDDPNALAEWLSASNVAGRRGSEAAGQEGGDSFRRW